MPTLELHGFDPDAAVAAVKHLRGLLGKLPYRTDIVFDFPRTGHRVEGWDGTDRPFIRVCSRKQGKLDELRSMLVSAYDVETLLIGYYPRLE